jgi:hypothetical protein
MQDIKQDAAAAMPRSSSWYPIYFAAVLETDRSKALIQIERAERAIHERLIELRKAPANTSTEVHDLSNALNYLEILLHNLEIDSRSPLWD